MKPTSSTVLSIGSRPTLEDAANLIVRDKFNGYLNPKGKVDVYKRQNQSDDQQPITNNETQVDNQVATEVEQEKATSPKTPIMDDRDVYKRQL